MGGESSKSDVGSDVRAGRRKSIDAINAVFVANVCNVPVVFKSFVVVDSLLFCCCRKTDVDLLHIFVKPSAAVTCMQVYCCPVLSRSLLLCLTDSALLCE